ncbi:MAG TPA: hypothetical protein VGA78_17210, partial [Gemmatimonadales bacterium]
MSLPVLALLAVLLFLVPAALLAQSEAPPVLSEAEEIRLARSGAPPEVTKAATVLVLRNGKYVEAVKGSGDVTCLVNRSQPLSLEPECYDGEASITVLPIHRFQTEQRIAGTPKSEIDARVDERLRSGEFRLPRRPALVYMMSAAQVLYNDNGQKVGPWLPHLMWYFPYLKAADLGLPAAN